MITQDKFIKNKNPIQEQLVEAITTAIEFAPHLILMSRDLTEPSSKEHFAEKMVQFSEGLELLTDTINLSKSFVALENPAALTELENELLDLLKALLTSQSNGRGLVQILEEDLPRNIEQWQTHGLPVLLASLK